LQEAIAGLPWPSKSGTPLFQRVLGILGTQ
jgi:hypothetical protein